MSLRIFSASIFLLLSACGGPSDTVAPADPANSVERGNGTPPGEATERVACATAGEPVVDACTIDRVRDSGGELITIRHADGGFRRLRVSTDRRVEAADGANPATVSVRGGLADVMVDGARYRLPIARP